MGCMHALVVYRMARVDIGIGEEGNGTVSSSSLFNAQTLHFRIDFIASKCIERHAMRGISTTGEYFYYPREKSNVYSS